MEMLNPTDFVFHSICTRQFNASAPYSCWNCSNDEIIDRTCEAMTAGNYTEGDNPGSFVVTISPENVFTAVVELQEGQKLAGTFAPRRGTSNSIKNIHAIPLEGQIKMPAKSCQVIVYDVEGKMNIVSVNGSPEETGTPMNPYTLIRNYFMIGADQAHGTNLSQDEFVSRLHEYFVYWENKAQLG